MSHDPSPIMHINTEAHFIIGSSPDAIIKPGYMASNEWLKMKLTLMNIEGNVSGVI
jgi:hypothetical protein